MNINIVHVVNYITHLFMSNKYQLKVKNKYKTLKESFLPFLFADRIFFFFTIGTFGK